MDPVEFEEQKASTREALVRQRAGQLVSALIAERREALDVSFDPKLLATFSVDQTNPASS